MNKFLTPFAVTATAALAAFSINVNAASSDDATDIVTVADACELKAVGIDFGIQQAGTNAAAITSTTPNTDTVNGNGATGHDTDTNSGAGADTGDFVSLAALGLPTVLADLVGTALDNVSTPGITAACTTIPSNITVTGDGQSVDLAVTNGNTAAVLLDGLTLGTLNYDVTFTGAAVINVAATPLTPGIFVGVYTSAGSIDAGQTLVNGAYQNVLTASLVF